MVDEQHGDEPESEPEASDADQAGAEKPWTSPITDAMSGMLDRAGLDSGFFANLLGDASATSSFGRMLADVPPPMISGYDLPSMAGLEMAPTTSEQVGWALEPVIEQLEALGAVMRTQAEMQRGLLEQQERDRVAAQAAAAKAQAANDRRARHALIPAWVSIGVAIASLGVALITIFG